MPSNQITIQLQGSPEDDGHIRLSEFLAQLEATRTALKNTERLVTGSDEPSLYYRVINLSYASPATVVLEAVSRPEQQATAAVEHIDHSAETVNEFFASLRRIRDERRAPRNADLQALQAYRDLAAVTEKHIPSIRISNTAATVDIDATFRMAVDEIIGPDELVEGSISGMLEKVNLHNTTRFDIFPTVGPQHVACNFAPELKREVIRGLAQYVNVRGTLRYKRLSEFPHAVDVAEIEIFPPEEDLPSLYDIRGIAPGATGDLTADEFVDSIRNAADW
jgi:hypothetical protein